MPKDVILIAAVTIDGLIARHRHEVITWSKDLRLFKEQTLGFNVIMGSNTHNILSTELEGRKTIVVHRNDEPGSILEAIPGDRCYIAGGGKTYARFAPFLTHLYITHHPLVFGKGIPLFDGWIPDLDLIFQQMVCVDEKGGVFQYQYRIRKS